VSEVTHSFDTRVSCFAYFFALLGKLPEQHSEKNISACSSDVHDAIVEASAEGKMISAAAI
jgi:hypothetical protein